MNLLKRLYLRGRCVTLLSGQITNTARPCAPGLDEDRWRLDQYRARLEAHVLAAADPDQMEAWIAVRWMHGSVVLSKFIRRFQDQRPSRATRGPRALTIARNQQ